MDKPSALQTVDLVRDQRESQAVRFVFPKESTLHGRELIRSVC